MTSPLKGPKSNVVQNIKYTGSDTEFSADIIGDTVNVQCNSLGHSLGSSKVKLINRIDYNWEFRYYRGNLVAAHINGKIVAYAMKGKDGGMVRVTNQETNQRSLIKNLKNDVRDVSFAFSRDQVILGCVDDVGNVLIYEIDDQPQAITYTLLLQIYHPDNEGRKANYRVIWCPYLPSFDDDSDSADDPEKMFVVLNGNKAEVWNVAMVNAKYGSGPIEPDSNHEGYIEITHSTDFVDASFSSDGTAIAVACSDGYVKFFQLYMFDSEKQKCLHEWRPHDGKPLSSIIFIDNVLEFSQECWKFTITGANSNSEIKLWSCETWTCLQTINFIMDPTCYISNVFLKMALDYTGNYLVLSDINNRGVYILQLNRNDQEQMVSVTMLAQFLVPAPFLSFHIMEASLRKVQFPYNNSSDDLYLDDRDEFDEDTYITAVCVKLLVIQPKKFQECNITFQPEQLLYNTSPVTDENLVQIQDEDEKVPKLDDLQSSVTLLIQQQISKSQLNLMTPEIYTSPGKNSKPTSRTSSINNDMNIKSVETVDENVVDNLIDLQQPQKDNLNMASGGSSPSREVQEILSLNNSTYSNQDYFDNLKQLQDDQEEPQKDSNTSQTDCKENGDLNIVWPMIPLVKDEIIPEETLKKDLLLEETTDLSKTQLQTINFRIGNLETAMQEQNVLLQKVHEDLRAMNELYRTTKKEGKEEFSRELDVAMSKQHLQIAKMLENLINMQATKDRDQQEQIISGVTQALMKTLAEKLPNIVSLEVKQVVIPAVQSLVESYKLQVEHHYAQKMASTDMMLRENITKAVNSKALADSLTLSVVNVVAPSLEKCYRDIIATSLIPSLERVCNCMFKQINDTFVKGTKEYTASVESYMDRQRRVQDKGKDLIQQMHSVSESMKQNADKLTATLSSEMQKQVTSIFRTMQDKLVTTVKEVVSEEVKQGFRSNASVIEDSVMNAVRSRAVTPAPDTQVTLSLIQQHLARGNFEEAFSMALSAENLNFVIYACEKTDINTLFGEECILPQSCLLALIQQLSVELTKNTDLKLNYIRAAFLALTSDYSGTKQFIPKVLKELLKQLQHFMATNPQMKHMIDAKMLKMAVENMLGK